MNIINETFLRSKFPSIKFAFNSNYIQKSFKMRKLNKISLVDTILVVDDYESWHKQNYTKNKKHYPLIARFTSIKLVNYFQKKGANIHFNTYTDEEGNILRYGVVGYNDFINDLKYWRTLTVSTYMHKPYELVIDNPSVYPFQNENLTSAICLSVLLNIIGNNESIEISEFEFYKKIVKIPYMNNSYFKLFEEINVDDIVEDLVDDFRNIYLPVIKGMNDQQNINFIKYDSQRNIFIVENTYKSRRFFAENLNFEIIKCMHQVLKHSPERMEQKIFMKYQTEEKMIEFIAENFGEKQKQQIEKSIRYILKKHSYSRIFLILMGKTFFFGFLIFKYIIKGIILYYLYKKTGAIHIPFLSKKE